MAENEKSIARQATIFLLIGAVLIVLLVLDLLNRGMIWQMLQSLRSPNNSTLPNEQRIVGGEKVTFLS